MVVVGSGIVFRLVDHEEYHSIWAAMWLALQTITTVGYGDVAPKDGRELVAALLMLNGIAFLAIVTAAITSTFVARATRTGLATDEDGSRADEAESTLASTSLLGSSRSSSPRSTASPSLPAIARPTRYFIHPVGMKHGGDPCVGSRRKALPATVPSARSG